LKKGGGLTTFGRLKSNRLTAKLRRPTAMPEKPPALEALTDRVHDLNAQVYFLLGELIEARTRIELLQSFLLGTDDDGNRRELTPEAFAEYARSHDTPIVLKHSEQLEQKMKERVAQYRQGTLF